MNRLKILLITSALLMGSSALASAEENHHDGFAVQVRVGDRGYFGFRSGDDDDHYRYYRYYRYTDRDDRGRDRDDRWRHDRDDRRFRDWDHDGDRR